MKGKPRVVIDARMVSAVGHGFSLYVRQLAEGLAALPTLPYEPYFLVSPACPRDSVLRKLPHAESRIPFLDKKELLLLGREIRRHRPALYHSPTFSSLPFYPCAHVQTVHDLNHLHYGNRAQRIYYRALLLRSLTSAREVLSVSEAAAYEIRSWLRDYGVEKNVGVAPNAIGEFPQIDDASVLHRYGLEKNHYFFALSNPKPHKNLALLERAYTKALEQRSIPPLAVSTPADGTQPHGVVRTGGLEDAEVGALLRHARAFFFPSLYEGFGRPPLEAALEGTPPVVSSIPVHREVLHGVSEAEFLDPENEVLWTEAFLRHAGHSERVGDRSRAWIRETWSVKRLATAMDRIYRSCLK